MKTSAKPQVAGYETGKHERYTVPLLYRLDRNGRIVWVNEAWTAFAEENGADNLRPAHVIGRVAMDYVHGEESRQLYRTLIEQARSGRKIYLMFRCDSPRYRRSIAMTVLPIEEEEIEFMCEVVRIEARPYVAVLDSNAPRDFGKKVKICSWCNKMRGPAGFWVEVEEEVRRMRLNEREEQSTVDYCICPACRQAVSCVLGPGAA